MRVSLLLPLLAVLVVLIWLFGLRPLAGTNLSAPPVAASQPPGEVLSFGRLQENEKVVLVTTASRRVDGADRVFRIEGGPSVRIAIRNLAPPAPGPTPLPAPVAGTLSREECAGLDAYLLFNRHHPRLGRPVSHRPDGLVVGYYRDGRKIGEERFTPVSDLFPKLRLEQGRIVFPAESPTVGDFPPEVFREIVTPEFVEYRLREAGRAAPPERETP